MSPAATSLTRLTTARAAMLGRGVGARVAGWMLELKAAFVLPPLDEEPVHRDAAAAHGRETGRSDRAASTDRCRSTDD